VDAATKLRWRKLGRGDERQAEQFLRSREYYGVSACAKFIGKGLSQSQMWRLADPSSPSGGIIQAMILRSGGILFPVLGNIRNIPPLHFLKGFLNKPPVHLVQGMLGDALLLEAALADLGCHATEQRDYDLMALDKAPEAEGPGAFPRGLDLRRPGFADFEALYPLQAGYEEEEVLPQGAAFNPAACRLALNKILSKEQSLIACLDKRVVGKINTNAASFTRVQIGGVYVLPEYRGLGIGRRMTAVFAGELIARGRGLSLFVKKNNPAAQKIYRRVGFEEAGNYRISYY
jgi:ribosomal protein S18 acetylase RimI-like enzyme